MLNSKINIALLAQYGLLASALPTMSPRAQPRIFARDCLPDMKSMAAATVTSPSHKRADASTLAAPAEYTANPSIGGGSGTFKDSAHFRVYGADDSAAEEALTMLEAAHTCFVEEVGWRSPGLSFNSGGVGQEVGPYYKMNVYSVSTGDLPGAAGVMSTDMGAGLPYLQVVSQYLTTPDVLVHEFGHAMHVSEKNWIDQGRTGAWWEPVANFIADLYIATPLCKNAKAAANLPDGPSIIALQKVVGDSFQVLVDGTPESANYYESWPFLSYITDNPDNFAGLSNATLLDMIRKYTIGSNDTPLHALENLLSDVTIQKLVGRYWARMAYVDIGHAKAQEAFEAQRNTINYANLDGSNGDYTVKSARAPRYMGANIIPLKSTSGTVSVAITSQSLDKMTATLAVKGANGTRYVDVESGKGSVALESGEDVSLVVANTPELVQYDPFSIPSELNQGLSYSVKIEGATAA